MPTQPMSVYRFAFAMNPSVLDTVSRSFRIDSSFSGIIRLSWACFSCIAAGQRLELLRGDASQH